MHMLLILFVVLTVVYVSLSFYSRAIRRDKLEAEWDAGGISTPREQFVKDGLKAYDGSLRRKLILGVYIIPVCLVALTIYLVNFA
ncbi:hypothetical protein [Tateyamaria pelophila]|uniref:hypothetical protein n=1 Tax=Tateyamaria pelophila TaxID=328415 RepID=UPI001CBF5CDC|nr:hypothetical protein [Tateyamaria pelophila]